MIYHAATISNTSRKLVGATSSGGFSTVTAHSKLHKVLFSARSVTFLFFFVWESNILRTAERICTKLTRKTCFVPCSDEFEGQGQRSRSPGANFLPLKMHCNVLAAKKRHAAADGSIPSLPGYDGSAAASVWFMSGKISLASSYISCESSTTRNVLWSRASVCLSVRGRMTTLLHGPGCNLGSGMGCPLLVHYWTDLQSVHGLRCYGNITRTRNVSEYMLVVHALCIVTFCVSRRRRKMYCGHARLCVCVCVSVCLSVRGRTPTLLHGPGCNGAW